jgi:hypothetical protein
MFFCFPHLFLTELFVVLPTIWGEMHKLQVYEKLLITEEVTVFPYTCMESPFSKPLSTVKMAQACITHGTWQMV